MQMPLQLKLNRASQSRRAESGHIRAWLVGVFALAVLGYLFLRHHEPPLQESKPPLVRHQIQRPSTSGSPQLTLPEGAPAPTASPARLPDTSTPTTPPTPTPLPSPPSLPPQSTTPAPSPRPTPTHPPPAASLPTVPAPATVTNSLTNTAGITLTPTNPPTSQRPRRQSRGEDPELSKGYTQAALEYQLALAKRGFYSGSLDGKLGSQSRAAIRAFQEQNNLPPTGLLAQETRDLLFLEAPLFTTYQVAASDFARLRPLATTWLGKSQQDRLDYETILELVAEQFMSHPALIQRLNPGVDWNNLSPGTSLQVPNVDKSPWKRKAGSIHIQLSRRVLQVYDTEDRLMQHMPCSIGHIAEKRPVGNLKVQVIAPNPNYTFNPAVFPESEEARQLGRKLRIEPGPNNPVGVAWIGLDRPGYGIHGTPNPEQVGRTESHGCFRLANWNAEQLAKIVWVGLPITVDP